jgi:hypothetical protein
VYLCVYTTEICVLQSAATPCSPLLSCGPAGQMFGKVYKHDKASLEYIYNMKPDS